MEMFGTWTAFLCGGLLALFFGGLGLFLIIHSQQSKRKALQSQSWPATKGIITQADIRTQEDDETIRYVPVISYSYEVAGRMYDGKRVSFGSDVDFGSRQKAMDYLAEYPPDAEVNVYYNPDKPNESVLQQVARKTTVGLVIGIVLLAVMLCLVCLMSTGIFRLLTG